MKRESTKLILIVAVFAAFFWLPVGWDRFTNAVGQSLSLARWYAREHVLVCLVPAFFIAGAIGVFIQQASVLKYLGAKANRAVAYGVASVSGAVLAVCSCTVLPLFAGIWRMGAGIGPAVAFLYAGPAVNVLAIILTARVLGLELGIARAVGAIVFSVVIGVIMSFLYRHEEAEKVAAQAQMPEPEVSRPLWQNAVFFFAMVGVLVFANWGGCGCGPDGPIQILYGIKWPITTAFAIGLACILVAWLKVRWWKLALAALPAVLFGLLLPAGGTQILVTFIAAVAGLAMVLRTTEGEPREWLDATWGFAKQILPLLLAGVLVAGFLLGGPGGQGLIPPVYVRMLVGETPDAMLDVTGLAGGTFEQVARAVWPLWTNFFASVFGAFMYFATLTEVPILQGLIDAGMGKGPALALLLAGPALSLPNMLVIGSVLGAKKTVTFVGLVVVMATISGLIYGSFF